MQTTAKSLENNTLAALAQRAAPAVVSAIKTAAQKTGVNFAYLMEQAAAESSFRPDAKAKTSSASGLYQFIESTWLGMVRDHGEKYGLSHYAEAIDARGRVKDPAMRREILALRNDPDVAALMAGEFAADNKRYLERFGNRIGDIGATELYMAHFLGAGGAASFLKAHKTNPLAVAADMLPQAARANYNVFYNSKTGKPRTVAEVYDFFDKKFSASKSGMFDDSAIALNDTPGNSAMPERITAGSDRSLRASHDAGPVLPEFSPFAHLNTRRDDNGDMRILLRTPGAMAAETIRWNSPRLQPELNNAAQVMLMAQQQLSPAAMIRQR